MRLPFRSTSHIRLLGWVGLVLLGVVAVFFLSGIAFWNQIDYKLVDLLYREAVKRGKGPERSPRVVYIIITDRSYEQFGANMLDRNKLAQVNRALERYGAETVGYDLIFARPSTNEADRTFAASIDSMGRVYLPMGIAVEEHAGSFSWERGVAFRRLRDEFRIHPEQSGRSRPFHARRALVQLDRFADACAGSGHISAVADADGIYRHQVMLLKVDDGYLPTLSLSMFLGAAGVPPDAIRVEWGRRLVVPAVNGSTLEQDIVIPIDSKGRAFVPLVAQWERDFPKMAVHDLIRLMDDPHLQGNLTEFFESKFVLVGDVASGISDLGKTAMDDSAPLIVLHASFLNAMMNNVFYAQWRPAPALGLVAVVGAMVCLASFLNSDRFFYFTGGFGALFMAGFAWWEMVHFRLFPLASAEGALILIFSGLAAGLQLTLSREKRFIKNAFSRYVPTNVVNQIIAQPELLQLGGEERELTILFSDLAGFTSYSENLQPPELVRMLNEYLTEMTDIIIANGGIIDKYIGDAIMAEFGAPIPVPDHADCAVRAALAMQRRLGDLRSQWEKRGWPPMRCRIGIHTGRVVVGNIGSEQMFDFTVIGDAVNLASRLEGANKFYGTELMMSESTHSKLTPGLFRTRPLGALRVKGKTRAIVVYEAYGLAGEEIPRETESSMQLYTDAWHAYQSRDFLSAAEALKQARSLQPSDVAALVFLERIESLDPASLSDDWDGSMILTTK